MTHARPAAVAGTFYPGDAATLSHDLDALLAEARTVTPVDAPVPKAIIAPHAGYRFSGATAARAYARVLPLKGRVTRVVLLGPAHRVAFRGMALPTVDRFDTPLGPVNLDGAVLRTLAECVPGVGFLDEAHRLEHSLEVHLPFLLAALGSDIRLVPVCVGEARAEDVAALLEAVWGGPETLIVVSTDLSHFLDYDACKMVDAATTAAVEALDPAALTHEHACGRTPLGGLLLAAKRKGLSIETLDVRSSGDTAGPRDRVVGYGAWALMEPSGETSVEALLRDHGAVLLGVARRSIRHGLTHGAALPVAVAAFPPPLRAEGASFVTLSTPDGVLRGCIGTPQAWRPLVEDVADNAYGAAFRDPRFPPVSVAEERDVRLSLSVLTPPETMAVASEADLLARLRPGVDGVIFSDGGRRGLFLPAVWYSLPDPRDFLAHLKRKAGLPADHWSATVRVERFTAKSVRE